MKKTAVTDQNKTIYLKLYEFFPHSTLQHRCKKFGKVNLSFLDFHKNFK